MWSTVCELISLRVKKPKEEYIEPKIVDTVPITFERFRSVCKFFAVGFDEDRKIEYTCRRKDMIPEGCSWGICDKEHCPYIKAEEE